MMRVFGLRAGSFFKEFFRDLIFYLFRYFLFSLSFRKPRKVTSLRLVLLVKIALFRPTPSRRLPILNAQKKVTKENWTAPQAAFAAVGPTLN